MDILSIVTRQAEAWESMGMPAIIERLCILRGKPIQGSPWKGRRMKAKQCYANAANLAKPDDSTMYVEGLAIRPDLGILIHHAWCVRGGKILDPTWERPETAFYLGVEIPHSTLWARLLSTGVYGLFNTDGLIPVEFLCELEPRLSPIWQAYQARRNGG